MAKKKLNIGIFIFDFYPIVGGQGKHLYELYKKNQELKRANFFIFSPNRNNLTNHITLFAHTRKSKLKNIAFSIEINKQINSLINEYNLDIVHYHGGPGGLFLFKKLPVKTIFTSHHTYWQQLTNIKTQSWKFIFYLFEKVSYKLADKVICVSDDTKEVVKKNYNIQEVKLITINNGITLDKTNKLRAHEIQSKDLIYVGRLDKRKGVKFLVETMLIIKAMCPSITLHLVGEGRDRNFLKAFCIKNKLPVKFYGNLTNQELNSLYKKVTIQVVPSIFEGFGLSVLEGMKNNIPIIATNTDGIKSIIINGKNGILIKYGDKQALAKSIVELINNKTLQKEIVKNANRMIKKFDVNKQYSKTLNVYEEVTYK